MGHPAVEGLKDPEMTKLMISVENDLKLASRMLSIKATFYPWARQVKEIVDNKIHAIELLIEERSKSCST